MAEKSVTDKGELFIKRAKQLNKAFLVSISVFFVISLLLYRFISLPVSAKLVVYIYVFELVSAVLAYGSAALIRVKMFPVSTSEAYWSYTAVRRYFWSFVLLCIPFGIGFVFYFFVGNMSALVLGYLLSVCGLIIFRPRKGDVI